MHRPPARLSLLALGLVALLLVASPALAYEYPTLSGPITDLVGKVDVNDPGISAALAALNDSHNIELRVLLADSMGGMDPGDYARAAAQANNLGTFDGLLVITFADRQYGIWLGEGTTSVSVEEIHAILDNEVASALRAGDVTGAIVAAAEGLGTAAAPAGIPAPDVSIAPAIHNEPLDLSGFFGALLVLFLGLGILTLLVGGGFLAFRWYRTYLTNVAEAARMRDLSAKAASAVVSTDEALKAAAQEVDFVEAEFGAEQAAAHRSALKPLTELMSRVFALAAKLNDPALTAGNAGQPSALEDVAKIQGSLTAESDELRQLRVPDDIPPLGRLPAPWRNPVLGARSAGYQQILEATAELNAGLEIETKTLHALRDLENALPTRLPALATRLTATRGAIAAAEPQLAALATRSASANKAVANNVSGAQKLAELADKDLASAKTKDASKGEATLVASRAEGRLAKIDILLAGIATMTEQVQAADKALPGHLVDAQAEIERAAGADTANDVKDEEAQLKIARAKLAQAKSLAASDPYAADSAALGALQAADAVVGQIRDAQEARVRKEQAAKEALGQAQRSLTEAKTYIDSHSSVVSAGARTRLAQASAQLSPYHSGMDPLQLYLVLSLLQSAQHNASAAYTQAQSDVSNHESSYSSSYVSPSHDTFAGGSFDGGISGGGGFGGGVSAGGGW